jgi:hypothetical protein
MGAMTGKSQGDTPQELGSEGGDLQVTNESNQSFGSTMEAQARRIADAQKRAQEFRTQLMGTFVPGQGGYRANSPFNSMGQSQGGYRGGYRGAQGGNFMGLLGQLGQPDQVTGAWQGQNQGFFGQQQQYGNTPQGFFGYPGNNGA